MTAAQLRAEMPVARAFLADFAGLLLEPVEVRIHENADRTVDGEARVFAPQKLRDLAGFFSALVTAWFEALSRHPAWLGRTWWARILLRFKRRGEVWRKYKLGVFRSGLEELPLSLVRVLEDAGECFELARQVTADVTNAHLSPRKSDGMLRPEYRLVAVLVRIHRGDEAPNY